MSDLYRVGSTYLPAALLSTSGGRVFHGDLDPSTVTTLVSGEVWDDTASSTAPPPPVTTKPMLIGASPEDYDNLTAALANTGTKPGGVNSGLQCRRSYDTGPTPTSFATSKASGDPSRGCASYWSCGGEDISAVASGTRDAAITAFFNSIPANHTMFITYWHEADNGKVATSLQATFRQAQAHLHDLLQASSADTTRVKLAPLLTDWGFSHGDPTIYFPSDPSKYDFVGVDTYEYWRPPYSPTTTYYAVPNDPKSGSLGQERTPDYLIGAAKTFADNNGKKLVIGEYSAHPFPAHPSYYSGGVADQSSRPWRIQRYVDYCDTAGALAFCFYHSSAGGSGPWWLDAFHNWNNISDRSFADPDTMAQIRTILSVRAASPG